MKISVLHASRQRPVMAAQTAKKWLSSALHSFEYIMMIDTDDPTAEQYNDLLPIGCALLRDNNKSAIEAFNNAAKLCTGDLILAISDDFDCPMHWDALLTAHLTGKSDFVVKTDDGLQPWIITLPVLDRIYYERFGYVYNPRYFHMFCDTEMTHVADLLDRKITIPMKFPHNHYTTMRVKKDAVNEKNDKTWAQGEAVYLEGVMNNFGLIDPPGVLRCDVGHLRWLESKGIKMEIV